ncbi:MAG: gas vesicle protein GvpG [Candidatus Nanopelagicales bacterium]
MNILTSLLLSPFTLPSKALMYPFEKVHEQAERTINDPVQIRATLLALQKQLDAGFITEQAYERAEAQILARLDAYERRRAAELLG